MIPVIHTTVEEQVGAEDDPLPAGAWDVALDWQAVADAFAAASRQLDWNADFRICPERRLVEAVVPADRTDPIARTTLDFYAAVADRIGIDAFTSLWVDFNIAACSTPAPERL